MKTLMALILGMLLASTALAQLPENRNEVFVSIGDPGMMFLIDDVATIVLTLGTVTYGDQEGGVQVVAGYQRWLNRWGSVGVAGSWAGSRKTAYLLGRRLGEVERRQLTLMAEGRAHWLRRPIVELYSGLALGVADWSDDLVAAPDESGMFFAFHVVPVGLRVGGDWGGFLEPGLGLHSFLKGGLSRRF